MDALSYVTYPEETMINASYIAEGDDILLRLRHCVFLRNSSRVQGSREAEQQKGLIEGFLPSTGENYAAFKNDSIQAISYEGAGADGARLDVVLFANTLTNKVHQRDEFNFISNAAFDAVADDSGQSVSGYTDVAADAWYADAVQQAAAAGAMNGVGGGKFARIPICPRAMLTQILYNMEEKPPVAAEHKFSDVASDAWYTDAVIWSAAENIVTGYGDGTFGPMKNTREQLATMLYRYTGSPDTAGCTGFRLKTLPLPASML